MILSIASIEMLQNLYDHYPAILLYGPVASRIAEGMFKEGFIHIYQNAWTEGLELSLTPKGKAFASTLRQLQKIVGEVYDRQ